MIQLFGRMSSRRECLRGFGLGASIRGSADCNGGTGSLSKLKGGGVFKAQMTSPSDSEMTWSGAYED